ncbi:REP-associated tyrosine transposase [Pseudomonas sp. HK3]
MHGVLHAIWTLPESDTDYSKRWGRIKALTTKQLKKNGFGFIHKSIWQSRFWEHQIRDESDLNTHLDYIHINPVKHGFVITPNEWPYSTYHKYLNNGFYANDWGKNLDITGQFGE